MNPSDLCIGAAYVIALAAAEKNIKHRISF